MKKCIFEDSQKAARDVERIPVFTLILLPRDFTVYARGIRFNVSFKAKKENGRIFVR